MTTNQLAYMANLETARANREREFETRRNNLANERETNRSNVAREQETFRSNFAKEQENYRSNIARENDARSKNALTAQNILNQYVLGSRQASAAEMNAFTNRYNSNINQQNADTARMQAITSQNTLSENMRHNVTMEQIQKWDTGLDAATSTLRAIGSFF